MPSRTEHLATLALRYQGAHAGSDEAEEARLRLLIEDCADIPLDALALAIKDGVNKLWDFMPTSKQLHDAARDYVSWSKPAPTYERPALSDQSTRALSDDTDVDALLRDTFAKLSAGHQKLMGVPLQARASSLPPRPAATRMPTEQDYAEIRAQMGG